LDADQFWRVTLRTYATVTRAHQRRLIDQHNELAWLALQSATLQREKRLPKLTRMLVKYPRERPQTQEEMRRVVRMMVDTFKGP
jgi:hypothetical protein